MKVPNKVTSIAEMKSQYVAAKKAYYEGEPLMSDAEFDRLEEKIRAKEPRWIGLKHTGARVGKKVAVPLTYPMASLEKIQADKPEVLQRFVSTHTEWIVMPKIDGSSVELTYRNGKPVRLVTRGDGVEGKNISFFLPYLKQLPTFAAKAKHLKEMVLRCEAVLNKRVWEAKWAKEFDNPRNQVAGVFNRQDIHPSLVDIQFIVLRIQSHGESLDVGLSMFKELVTEKKGLVVVPNKRFATEDVTSETLTSMLAKAKEKMPVDLDGLVIHSVKPKLPITGDKPKYARAWKSNDVVGELAEVTQVTWQVSRHGTLIPVLHIIKYDKKQ